MDVHCSALSRQTNLTPEHLLPPDHRSPPKLPAPSAEALQHSARLAALIGAEIAAAGGAIPFARYMELALYAPGLGYYSAGAQKFGAAGDFVTASEISPLFSACVARQCAEVLRLVDGGDVLEVGAGSGVFAADLLVALAPADRLHARYLILERSADLRARHQAMMAVCVADLLGALAAAARLPARYLILERSAVLRARQQALLAERVPHYLERVQWLDRLPERRLRGVVFANELLDALPVHMFTLTEDGPQELYVAQSLSEFHWQPVPCGTLLQGRVDALLREVGELPLGYTSEINLAAVAWVRSVADILECGALLLADYGFPRREYYHSQRSGGTLMCHYRHHAHDNPFLWPGLQDITAHIDFTAVAETADAAGLDGAGYTTQGAFLLACGITEILSAYDDDTQLRLAQGVKKLTLPHEMGELFKVSALTRAIDAPLSGFAWRDLRAKL